MGRTSSASGSVSAVRTTMLSPASQRVARGPAHPCKTQVDVAKALARPQSFVTKCELGERRIDPIELQTFAALYRKRLSYFLPPLERR